MAMIDYGAIAFKNGKLISTNMFTPMVDMVGWEDTENDVYREYSDASDKPYMKPIKLKGNYFAYIGDADCTIAFYKEQIVIVKRYEDGTFRCEHEYFGATKYIWSKWEWYAGSNWKDDNDGLIKVTKRNGYLVCKWKYKGDKYKVYFGYGVDLPYYKKRHIVNYYRSPRYRLYKIKRWLEDEIYDWKYSW